MAGIAPGQLVATGGAGKANHAEWQAVPALLCSPVPDGIGAEQAAFATVGSIALHGLRLAGVGPGANVAVIGLGLVGQLAARLAVAAGCRVIGLDVAPFPIERAASAGVHALHDDGDATSQAVLDWTRGQGVDAVLITAADRSSAVMRRVPVLCRDRATVVVVGDVGLDLERTPLYEKELSLHVARSYGPGATTGRMRSGASTIRSGRCAGPRAATSRRCSICWLPAGSRWTTSSRSDSRSLTRSVPIS